MANRAPVVDRSKRDAILARAEAILQQQSEESSRTSTCCQARLCPDCGSYLVVIPDLRSPLTLSCQRCDAKFRLDFYAYQHWHRVHVRRAEPSYWRRRFAQLAERIASWPRKNL